MTTTTVTRQHPTTATASAQSPRRTTSTRVLRSEWIKVRTLRSTWITIAGIALALIGFGLIAALTASGQVEGRSGGPGNFNTGDPVGTVLAGANFAVLIVAVLGAIVGAREYSTGMIRTTLAAVPRRLPVLWGKLLTFVGILMPVVFSGVVIAFFTGMQILDAGDAATVAWSDDGVTRAVLGSAAYVVGIGVVGVALGVLLRTTAAAIGTVIGGILFVPTLATALLPESWDGVLKYLPSNAGQAFTTVAPDASLLSPGVGMAVFGGWVLLAVIGAALAMVRRDV
jgi:ABC-type transport system involved in multi-copper enzyme maturation permease subunit